MWSKVDSSILDVSVNSSLEYKIFFKTYMLMGGKFNSKCIFLIVEHLTHKSKRTLNQKLLNSEYKYKINMNNQLITAAIKLHRKWQ